MATRSRPKTDSNAATTKAARPAGAHQEPGYAPRSMFMNTLNFEPARDLVHLGLMDYGPDGDRPDLDGPTLAITLPLSQFEPMMDQFAAAFADPALERHRQETVKRLGL